MSVPTRDAAFELIGACVHSLRFVFGAPLNYPDAVARFPERNPPPALFPRIVAASPPPDREGALWYAGLILDDEPFQPKECADRLAEVRYEDGIPALDMPEPDTIMLDQVLTVPRQDEPRDMRFPGSDRGRYVLSIDYWPSVRQGTDEYVESVDYYETFTLPWSRTPEGDWVAVSFEGFWPPERDSADLIIPLSECTCES